MSKELLNRIGIRHPIIQAPMAGVSTPELAAAVSKTGGLGSIAICGVKDVAEARANIEKLCALTSKPFNVNVFCHKLPENREPIDVAWIQSLAPFFEEYAATPPSRLNNLYHSFLEDDSWFELLLELKPAVVSFHFGFARAEQLAALKAAGIFTLATVTNLEEALLAEAAGIDAVVAQGIEAGGHRGVFDADQNDEQLETLELVSLLAKKQNLPIIAAGGIMDGADISRALKAGASAAQLGTAFILSPESSASASHRANLQSKRAANTEITRAISGRPARGIVNRLIEFGRNVSASQIPDYPLPFDVAKQLNAVASEQGDFEFAAHWAGSQATRARALPATELVSWLVATLD